MKPVQMTDFSRGLLTRDSLLLLDISALGLRYAIRLLTHNNTDTSIRSKGGRTLPNEIWSMILDFTRKGAKDVIDSRVCLVKADHVAASPNTMLLRCFRHKFDYPADKRLAGNLEDSESVFDFQSYLACATPSTAKTLRIELPDLHRLSGPDNTFDVVLGTTPTDHCLYTFRDVPDFIAVIDDGSCWVCRGARFICPGCTGGIADNFDVFMGCGVDLACPLCMGMDFSLDHKSFLQTYYWDEPPEHEAADMRELVEERLKELGYTDITIPEGTYRRT